MRTVLLAAVAVMLALPAQAQSGPPPVPRYSCPMPSNFQRDMEIIMQRAWQYRDAESIGRLTIANGMVDGYVKGCQDRYQRAMIEWQAEMQRYEMQRRYGN